MQAVDGPQIGMYSFDGAQGAGQKREPMRWMEAAQLHGPQVAERRLARLRVACARRRVVLRPARAGIPRWDAQLVLVGQACQQVHPAAGERPATKSAGGQSGQNRPNSPGPGVNPQRIDAAKGWPVGVGLSQPSLQAPSPVSSPTPIPVAIKRGRTTKPVAQAGPGTQAGMAKCSDLQARPEMHRWPGDGRDPAKSAVGLPEVDRTRSTPNG